MDIDSSYFTNYLNTVKDNASDTSAYAKLNEKLKTADSSATDDELMDVCKQFEAYFVEQVFKEMEKTVPKSEGSLATDNQLVDYFKDNLRQKLSAEAADQQGLGLARMLYDQMKRNYSAVSPSEIPDTNE